MRLPANVVLMQPSWASETPFVTVSWKDGTFTVHQTAMRQVELPVDLLIYANRP